MNRKSFDYVGADVVERAARGDIEDVSASFWLPEHDLQVAVSARRRRHLSLATKGVPAASASTVEGYTRSFRFSCRDSAVKRKVGLRSVVNCAESSVRYMAVIRWGGRAPLEL